MRYSISCVCAVAIAACSFAVDANAQSRASRPSGGRPTVGRSVPRPAPAPVSPRFGSPGAGRYFYRPYYPYYRYPYYGYGSSFSFGLFFGSPYYYGYPYYSGYPYYYAYPSYGYPAYGYPSSPYYPSPYYPAPYGSSTYHPSADPASPSEGRVTATPGIATGEVRIVGAPQDAQVYADGQLVGTVADFAGPDQRLVLAAGSHNIEIRANGAAPLSYDVDVRAGQRVSLQANIR